MPPHQNYSQMIQIYTHYAYAHYVNIAEDRPIGPT